MELAFLDEIKILVELGLVPWLLFELRKLRVEVWRLGVKIAPDEPDYQPAPRRVAVPVPRAPMRRATPIPRDHTL